MRRAAASSYAVWVAAGRRFGCRWTQGCSSTGVSSPAVCSAAGRCIRGCSGTSPLSAAGRPAASAGGRAEAIDRQAASSAGACGFCFGACQAGQVVNRSSRPIPASCSQRRSQRAPGSSSSRAGAAPGARVSRTRGVCRGQRRIRSYRRKLNSGGPASRAATDTAPVPAVFTEHVTQSAVRSLLTPL